jgi:hypothetical protein
MTSYARPTIMAKWLLRQFFLKLPDNCFKSKENIPKYLEKVTLPGSNLDPFERH